MLSRADQLGIRATDDDLDRAIATTRSNYGFATDEEFDEALRASGMDLESYRNNMKQSLLVQKLMSEEVHPRVTLDEEDLRRFYQNHLDEYSEPERLSLQEVVVLSSSGLSGEDLEQRALEIRQKIEEGGDLAEIVKPYAEAGETSNAVDLGWVEIGDLDAELEQAVWQLETGGVSEPVKGRGGLHVLVVTERQEARLKPFAEVEGQIRGTEGERLLASEMQRYLEELETSAYVVVNPPPDAIGFRASLQMTATDNDLEEALTAPLITAPAPVDPLPGPPANEAPAEAPFDLSVGASREEPRAEPESSPIDLTTGPGEEQDDADEPPLDLTTGPGEDESEDESDDPPLD
jgi:parvulin-like peptidyl-prolyl isomerase